MKKTLLPLISVLFLLLALKSPSYADTITFKSGKVIEGKILEQIDNDLTIQTDTGIRIAPFKMIAEISGPASVELYKASLARYIKKYPRIAGTLPDPEKYDYHIEKMNDIPDVAQLNNMLPGGGSGYCGPMAISNSLLWLDKIGYDKIVPGENHSFDDQIQLAKTLGTKYFNTIPTLGTKTRPMLKGLEKYLKNRGYSNHIIGYKGIQSYSRKSPSINWIKKGITEDKVAWLRLGFYKKNNNKYTRKSGHWVTLVGYGLNKHNKPGSNILIIHNSWGSQASNDYIYLKKITGGSLHRGYPKRISAAGFYIADNFPVPSKADVAIIEGAIVLNMNQ